MFSLQHYWSGNFLAANAFIGLNLIGALLLGMIVGYERSLAEELASSTGVASFSIVPVRN